MADTTGKAANALATEPSAGSETGIATEAEPQTVTVSVELPPQQPHETPDDEVAVAIPERPIDPGKLPSAPSIRSMTLVTPQTGPLARAEGQPEHVGSRRDRLRGEPSELPESAAMLTADRILDVRHRPKARPTGVWNKLVYGVTFAAVNLGDSKAERHRKELDHRIRRELTGGARFIPVLTRKGGVGKTTVTALLGMALADVRDDRIIAVDANPDRGTLSERVARHTSATVRDVVHRANSIGTYTDFAQLVSHDETRLDVLASDTDPNLSEAFDEDDYNVVAGLAGRYYSFVLTDCGTGIVHSVMRATLHRADEIVVVSGGSVDEAKLASETLTWLDANGYGDLVQNAVVAINTATQGTNLVMLDEIEAHFRSRVRELVRIPYDPLLAAGSVVPYRQLRSLTRESARTLAALVVEGLPDPKE